MNRKNLVLMLAALLGILFLASTCGVALAGYPVFYVKIDNKTNNAIKIKYNFSTRAGKNANESKKYTFPPHTTTKFSGPRGNGQMNVWMHTGGEGGIMKKYSLKGEDNPQAPNALFNINYNKDGHLRIFDPKK
jgi:hypothetical protein